MNNENRSVFDTHVRVRPYRAGDEAELNDAAAKDSHGVLAPTHILTKNNEIVGYFSIGAAPTALLWFDSKKMTSRDSIEMVNFYENFLSALGIQAFILPVWKGSPLHDYAEKIGYVKVGEADIYMKTLNKGGC